MCHHLYCMLLLQDVLGFSFFLYGCASEIPLLVIFKLCFCFRTFLASPFSILLLFQELICLSFFSYAVSFPITPFPFTYLLFSNNCYPFRTFCVPIQTKITRPHWFVLRPKLGSSCSPSRHTRQESAHFSALKT